MGTRRLEVNIIGDPSSLSRAFGTVQRDMGKLEATARRVGRGLAVIGTGAALTGIAALAASLRTGVDEMLAQDAASAQTTAAIKSTGASANVTKGQIEGMASALQETTGVQDDAIQSAENLLLTFTNIKNSGQDKIFDQATKATLDLSTAFHKDLNSSAVMVGKALQDPVKGITALSRVGVQFTAQQKEQIKTLVESGRSLDAQKLILRELNREVGGSAKAFGDTTAGQVARAKRMWEDFSEELARRVLPVVLDVVDFIRSNMPAIERVTRTAFQGAQRAVAATMAYYRANILPTIHAIVTGAKAFWSRFGGDITKAFNLARTVVGNVMRAIAAVINGILAVIRGDWSTAWSSLKTVVRLAMNTVLAILRGVPAIVLGVAIDIGKALTQGILSGIGNLAGAIRDKVTSAFSSIAGLGSSLAKKIFEGGPDFALRKVAVGSPTDLSRAQGAGDRSAQSARLGAEGAARQSGADSNAIKAAGDKAYATARLTTIGTLTNKILTRRGQLVRALAKARKAATAKLSGTPAQKRRTLDARRRAIENANAILDELETLAADYADLQAEAAQLGSDIAELDRTAEANAQESEAQTASDRLDAAAAEAALTPGNADDLAAARAIEDQANAELSAARASGDPRRIAEAARAALSARQGREQIEATMANTEALVANTDAIAQSFGGSTTFGYQGQQYVLGSLAPPSSDRLTGMEVGV